MADIKGIKKIVFMGFIPLSLIASESNFNYTQNKNSLIQSFVDSDLDGVADIYDECPNTSFLEIVNANGCAKDQKPISSYYIWVSSGITYTEKNYIDTVYKNSSQNSHKDDGKGQGDAHNGGHNNNGNWHHGKKKYAGMERKREKYKELYIPFTVFVSKKNWLYSFTTGYISVKDKDEKTKSISDTTLSVGYLFDLTDKNLPVFSLKAKVKVPTSKLSHKSDYTFQGEVYKSFGANYLFLDGGYTALGSFNGYKNLYYFDVDYSRSFKGFDLGMIYSFSRNTHSERNLQNATLYLTYDINEKLRLYTAYTRDFFDSRGYKSFTLSISRSF